MSRFPFQAKGSSKPGSERGCELGSKCSTEGREPGAERPPDRSANKEPRADSGFFCAAASGHGDG